VPESDNGERLVEVVSDVKNSIKSELHMNKHTQCSEVRTKLNISFSIIARRTFLIHSVFIIKYHTNY
jgi:hypothetical protein